MPRGTPAKRRSAPRRVLPFVVVAALMLFIAAREVPQVADTFDRLVRPERWAAAQACRERAVELARQPDYARIIERGEVHPTTRGFYIDGIVVGQMGAANEERFAVECYADARGKVVRIGVPEEGG